MIEFVAGGRQTGKTKRLLEWMKAAPEGERRVIICHSRARAVDLRRECQNKGIPVEEWQFCGPDEPRDRKGAWNDRMRRGLGRVVFGVDDLDLILGGLIGGPVGIAAWTGEPAASSPPTVMMEA